MKPKAIYLRIVAASLVGSSWLRFSLISFCLAFSHTSIIASQSATAVIIVFSKNMCLPSCAARMDVSCVITRWGAMRRTLETGLQRCGTLKDAQCIFRHTDTKTTGNVDTQVEDSPRSSMMMTSFLSGHGQHGRSPGRCKEASASPV